MKCLFIILCIGISSFSYCQDWQHPLVDHYGSVVEVPGAELMPSPNRMHRVVFDLVSRDDKDGVNTSLWYLARLRNLYALAGVPADSLDILGVLHGGATTLALSTTAAQTRGDTALTDDLALMADLAAGGVRFYVCGQSAASAGIDIATELNAFTIPALSAMTTLLQLKRRGYQTP